MSPSEGATLIAAAAAVICGVGVTRILRGDETVNDPKVRDRARRIAEAHGFARKHSETPRPERDEAAFRARHRARGWRKGLAPVLKRYPLLTARSATLSAIIGAVVGIGAVFTAATLLRFDIGAAGLAVAAVGALGGARTGLRWQHGRRRSEFVRQFPEVVDQVVRLSAAGVPALEAIGAVYEESEAPVKPVLGEISDALRAGLDADQALRITTERVRMAELTMFAGVVKLQRRSGGSVSQALTNLATTLRDRRKSALRAHAATAETRVTIIVLTLLPIFVIGTQTYMTPDTTAMLFTTDTGALLLRLGFGLIATGIGIAWALAARITST